MANIQLSNIGRLYQHAQNTDVCIIERKNGNAANTYSITVENLLGDTNSRLNVIEGQMGLLNTGTIQCYMAPAAQYFIDNGFTPKTDSNGRTYYVKDGAEYSYGYGQFYPGADANLEQQYKAYGKAEAVWYPVFSLNTAMSFLRRFRSNGTVTYWAHLQYGDYEYGSAMQYISHPDATGQSVVHIAPYYSSASLQALNAANDPNCVTSPTFKDSDLVKARLIWEDDPQLTYSSWFNGVNVADGNVNFDGIGLVLRLKKSAAVYDKIGASANVINIISGKTSFYQCVIRNGCLTSNISEGATIRLYSKTMRSCVPSGSDATADFDLDHLYKYKLPVVFADDPVPTEAGTPTTIGVSYIPLYVGGAPTLYAYGAYVVFKTGRRSSPIGISTSAMLHITYSYRYLTKLVFVQNDGEKASVPFSVGDQSTISLTRESQPADAKNSEISSQIRIELAYSDSEKPAWLSKRTDVTTSGVSGYNPQTGTTDKALGTLRQNAIVTWNGQVLPA